ncbi:MAG: hypothetical protein D6828_02635, partial [Nitrospirae bacterium]
MRLYEIPIEPTSGFGTPLKGDTIFGHFCWQAFYDPNLVKGSIEEILADYDREPFIVFSSAIIKLNKELYAFKRPDMPLCHIFPREDNDRVKQYKFIKEKKKREWMLIRNPMFVDLSKSEFKSSEELAELINRSHKSIISSVSQPHNKINRLTNTTGTGEFAPYTHEYISYLPNLMLTIFVLFDESIIDIDSIHTALERIGRWGFGRDASTGMGRFKVGEPKPFSLPKLEDADTFYTLSPCILEHDLYEDTWFKPFIRYGKHGDRLANSRNPFKNIVVMADEGAVFVPRNKKDVNKPYIGRAVKGIS